MIKIVKLNFFSNCLIKNFLKMQNSKFLQHLYFHWLIFSFHIWGGYLFIYSCVTVFLLQFEIFTQKIFEVKKVSSWTDMILHEMMIFVRYCLLSFTVLRPLGGGLNLQGININIQGLHNAQRTIFIASDIHNFLFIFLQIFSSCFLHIYLQNMLTSKLQYNSI